MTTEETKFQPKDYKATSTYVGARVVATMRY